MSKIIKRALQYPTSDAVKRLNPGFFKDTHKTMVSGGESIKASESVLGHSGAIAPHFLKPSSDEQKLNKTEKAYLGVLRSSGHHWIGIQCISLKLGDDCRYNPDFLVITSNGVLEAHEVKGFMREDALVKLKVASRMYRWLRIILVQRVQGQWASSLVRA